MVLQLAPIAAVHRADFCPEDARDVLEVFEPRFGARHDQQVGHVCVALAFRVVRRLDADAKARRLVKGVVLGASGEGVGEEKQCTQCARQTHVVVSAM